VLLRIVISCSFIFINYMLIGTGKATGHS